MQKTSYLHTLRIFILLIFSATFSSPLYANGYDYPDLGASALGRGAAFVAKADDPMALYYNPAGATRIDGTRLLLGSNLIMTYTSFERYHFNDPQGRRDQYPHLNNATDPDTKMPKLKSTEKAGLQALFMATTDLHGVLQPYNLRLLLGIYGPNSHQYVSFPKTCLPGLDICEEGGEGDLPNPARYDGYSRDVFVIFPSIGVAWSPLPWLSIGAVLQFGYVDFSYHLAVGALVGENPVEDIDVQVEIDSKIKPIGLFGIHVRPFEWLELGVSARTGFTFKGEGIIYPNANSAFADKYGYELGFIPDPAPATLDIPFPWVVRSGVRYVNRDAKKRERFDIEFDFIWEENSSLQSFDVMTNIEVVKKGTNDAFINPIKKVSVQHQWTDSVSLRLGGSYTFYDVLKKFDLSLRAGTLWESSPMPEQYTRLDFLSLERYGLTTGLGIKWNRYRFDIAYALLLHKSRTVAPADGENDCGLSDSGSDCGSLNRELVPSAPSGYGFPIGNGRYENTIHQLSASIQVSFDE